MANQALQLGVFVETQTQKWLLIWDAGSDDVG